MEDMFSIVLGFVGWFGMFMYSQRILDNNLFKIFAYAGVGIFVLSVIKQALTAYNSTGLLFAFFPLLFVGFFRLLTYVFFKGYPNIPYQPTIVIATDLGLSYYKKQDSGYKPTIKERLFSLILFLGFIGIALCIALLLKLLVT